MAPKTCCTTRTPMDQLGSESLEVDRVRDSPANKNNIKKDAIKSETTHITKMTFFATIITPLILCNITFSAPPERKLHLLLPSLNDELPFNVGNVFVDPPQGRTLLSATRVIASIERRDRHN